MSKIQNFEAEKLVLETIQASQIEVDKNTNSEVSESEVQKIIESSEVNEFSTEDLMKDELAGKLETSPDASEVSGLASASETNKNDDEQAGPIIEVSQSSSEVNESRDILETHENITPTPPKNNFLTSNEQNLILSKILSLLKQNVPNFESKIEITAENKPEIISEEPSTQATSTYSTTSESDLSSTNSSSQNTRLSHKQQRKQNRKRRGNKHNNNKHTNSNSISETSENESCSIEVEREKNLIHSTSNIEEFCEKIFERLDSEVKLLVGWGFLCHIYLRSHIHVFMYEHIHVHMNISPANQKCAHAKCAHQSYSIASTTESPSSPY